MNPSPMIVRDERSIAVENDSYRVAYIFIVYALLIDVIYRSLAYNEAPWDLLALVVLGGAISTAYQARQQALPPSWAKTATIIALFGGVIAFIVAAVMSIL